MGQRSAQLQPSPSRDPVRKDTPGSVTSGTDRNGRENAWFPGRRAAVKGPDSAVPLNAGIGHRFSRLSIMAPGGTAERPGRDSPADDSTAEREAAAVEHGFGATPVRGSEDVGARVTPAEAPTAARKGLRTGGQPLDERTQALMEGRFHRGFDRIRIHSNQNAADSAAALGARAFTLGTDIVFARGAYAPGSASGRALLAHELTHVMQQERAPAAGRIQRAPAPPVAAAVLAAGDRISLTVQASADARAEPMYSRSYVIDSLGAIDIDDGQNKFSIPLAGLSPPAAAERIAARFVSEQLLAHPRIGLTPPGGAPEVFAQIQPSELDRTYGNFLNYLHGITEPADAVLRYHKWLDEHQGTTELRAITPPELWAQSLNRPQQPSDPRSEKTDEFLRFIKGRHAEAAGLTDPKEKSRTAETLRQFLDWYNRTKDTPAFLTADLAKIYADLWVGKLRKDIEESSRKQLAAQKEATQNSPQLQQKRAEHFDSFYALARGLWGYSSRTFPYVIPVDSKGEDILVTGDPQLQLVLNSLAGELVSWAAGHMFDAAFLTTSPKSVLVDLLHSGYSKAIAAAQRQPLEHEHIDRNELLPGSVLASFGATVGKGLLVIGLVGLFVGAEVITLGQATWLLAGVAAVGGVGSYLGRREEIEKSGYDVPIPVTIVHSAGDIVGVSQLVEGINGRRLGTDAKLGSEARSSQLGEGAGNVTTLLLGSRAYRAGEIAGTKVRLPGKTPSGPNAYAGVRLPRETVPPVPRPIVNPGPLEASVRSGLPENVRIGFDRWMGEIRADSGNPETVLKSMTAERAQKVAEHFTKKQATETARGEEAERLRARAGDNPLRPTLKNVRREGNITIHYESVPPDPAEIAAAQRIAARTGEEVHVFGDSASNVTYPGIDGTIGVPARPLSIKAHSAEANTGSARFAAQEALTKANNHGYTQVEVEISIPGKSVEEVKAGWNIGPTRPGDHPLGPYYQGTTVSKITIQCADGVWVVPKPVLTGVAPARGPEERTEH